MKPKKAKRKNMQKIEVLQANLSGFSKKFSHPNRPNTIQITSNYPHLVLPQKTSQIGLFLHNFCYFFRPTFVSNDISLD